MKIFKYPCGYDGNIKKWWTFAPAGTIIRTDEVNDGVYKGFWVWIIVNENDKTFIKHTFNWKQNPEFDYNKPYEQIGVLEEQYLRAMLSSIDSVQVNSGKIYVNSINSKYPPHYFDYKIYGYKTGQEIKCDLNSVKYIGFAPLFIKNEIAIYFFVEDLA
jgi:hypothetical protein